MTAVKVVQPDKGPSVAGRNEPPPTGKPVSDQKRVNVDFPDWMVKRLDREAVRLGVSRQSLIKFWVGERLDRLDPA
jgi:hypothetical protein